jgi:uncharacterized protein (TIGR02001 family)
MSSILVCGLLKCVRYWRRKPSPAYPPAACASTPAPRWRRRPARALASAPAIRLRRRIELSIQRVALALALLIAADAEAQFSATVSFVTDYRYRGVSLSRDDPALQAGIGYDDPSGVYLGLFASNVRFAISSHRELQALPYVGYARRLASGVSAEIGAAYSAFTGPGDYDYAEAYIGASIDNLSGRLYYAPHYFGRDTAAFYMELNGTQPLSDRIRLLAHLGVIFNRGQYPLYGPTDRHVVDGRLGVAIDIDAFSLQASWVGIGSANTGYPISQNNRRNTAVVTLSRAF